MYITGDVEMLEPVSKVTLSQTIMEKIISAIKDGEWKVEERIPGEHELAKSFSVGRNTIREVIKTLNTMAVLRSCPGQGTFLCNGAMRRILSSELIDKGYENGSLEEITEIRMLLETQSAFWAAKRGTDAQRAKLKRILTLADSCPPEDADRQDEIHYAFHDTVIEMSNNSFLIHLFASVNAEVEEAHSKFDTIPKLDVADSIKDQESIITYITGGNAGEAKNAMERHLTKGLMLLKKNGIFEKSAD